MNILVPKVFSDGEDFVLAYSLAEAIKLIADFYGDTIEEVADDRDWVVVDPDVRLAIWEESPGHNEQTKSVKEWVDENKYDVPLLLCSRNF